MPMIKVNEGMLKALLGLLLITSDCLTIAENLDEETNCYVEGCAEEFCPFYNVENFIKYLTGEWEEDQNAERREV